MNFGFETAIGAMLSKIRKDMPVLHFATRSGPFSPQGNRANDTWCGQFMTCSALKRRGFKFEHIITCNPEDETFASKVRDLYARLQRHFPLCRYAHPAGRHAPDRL